MPTQCLICESSAVLDQHTAGSIVQLTAALSGFIQGWQPIQAREIAPALNDLLQQVSRALTSAVTHYNGHAAFIQSLEKHQFAGYDCLCLRCGARFDEITVSDVQPNAPAPQPTAVDPTDPQPPACAPSEQPDHQQGD